MADYDEGTGVYIFLLDSGEPLENIILRLKAAIEEVGAVDEYTGVVEKCNLVKALNDMRDIVNGEIPSTRTDVGKYRNEPIELIEKT